MKSIENISQKLEKVMLHGLSIAENSSQISFFQSEIILYSVDGSIFIYFKHTRGTSGNVKINIYEIGAQESYYLYDTINLILEDIAEFGEKANTQTTMKVYKSVIEFCSKIGFTCKDFEEAVKKLN